MSPAPLVAVVLGRPDATAAIESAWDVGEAIAVLDPDAPAAVLDATLARLRPTHLLDRDGRRPWPAGTPVADDVRAVVLTSGTTGGPKAVELTEAGLTAVGHGCNAALGVDGADCWLVCLPLHHVAGLAILARARAGGQRVVVHEGFDLPAVAGSPKKEGTTLVSLVPTTLGRLLDAGAPLHEYRRIVVGGAPLPETLRVRAATAGAPVVDAYGLSETGGGFVLDGQPIPGVDVRLGPDDEIRVRGPVVMRGYRLDPDATRAAFDDDGWFRTGDIGARGVTGGWRVVDRQRDFVITGGVNVSPSTVERVLGEHPGVTDVCVAGVPDEEWGERVVAYVVAAGTPPPSLEDLRAFARTRLRGPELPRQVVIVEEIPRSPGGKAVRRRLPPPD
jgi:O-succinylbenzoic acid--CoA ligase